MWRRYLTMLLHDEHRITLAEVASLLNTTLREAATTLGRARREVTKVMEQRRSRREAES